MITIPPYEKLNKPRLSIEQLSFFKKDEKTSPLKNENRCDTMYQNSKKEMVTV